MSDMKTVETDADPIAFLSGVEDAGRRDDAEEVMRMMQRITGQPPRMWGDSIIGFGAYRYSRTDGSEHRFFRTGISPRKANLSIYLMPGTGKYEALLSRLGPHKRAVSCLYLGRISKVDKAVLEKLIAASWADMADMYPES